MPQTKQLSALRSEIHIPSDGLIAPLSLGTEYEVFHRDLKYDGVVRFGMNSRHDSKYALEGFQAYGSDGFIGSVAPHRATFYSICIQLEGEIEKRRGLESIILHKYSINFVAPGDINEYLNTSPDAEFMYINFTDEFLMTDAPCNRHPAQYPFFEFGNPQVFSLEEVEFQQIHALFLAMDKEYHSLAWQRATMIRLIINQILIIANRRYLALAESFTERQTNDSDLIRRFKKALESQYSRHISVAELAEQLFVSPKYLSEAVKRYLGCTPSDIIQSRIILQAKYYLCRTSMTVAEIALTLNFEDQSYFTRFFRKHTLQTPTEFRQTNCVIE